MIGITRKHVIAVCVVIVVIVGLIAVMDRHKPATEGAQSSADTTVTSGINIANSSVLENKVDESSITTVENMTYVKASKNSGGKTGLFDAVVRQGSIANPSGDPTALSFMLDIPELQQSYRIVINDDDASDYHAVYVFCPDPSALVYLAFNCVEDQ